MKVAILRATGAGGLQDPRTGLYISSKRDTLVPYSDWAETQVNHKQLKLVDLLEESNYVEYIAHLTEAKGDEEAALESYRKSLPKPKPKPKDGADEKQKGDAAPKPKPTETAPPAAASDGAK